MKKILFVVVLTFFTSELISQHSWSSFMLLGRHARANSLGGAYTGVAEGVESLYYNPAGIANCDDVGVAYSTGYAGTTHKHLSTFDVGILAPIPSHNSGLGVSLSKLDFGDASIKLYNLSYALTAYKGLSVGVNLNYFEGDNVGYILTGHDVEDYFDIGVSAFYFIDNLLTEENDRLSIGLLTQNILNSKVSSTSDKLNGNEKYQSVNLGLAYRTINLFHNFPAYALIAVDLKLHTIADLYKSLQPSLGIELSVYEYLFVRYGRSIENNMSDYLLFDSLFPSNRYGLGLKLPLNKLFDTKSNATIEVDYLYSDYPKIDFDSKGFEGSEVSKNSFSVKIYVSLW